MCFVLKYLLNAALKLNLLINQEVSRRPVIVESRIQSQASSCGICDGQSGNETSFSPSASVSSVCIIPATSAPYSYFIRLLPKLHNLSN